MTNTAPERIRELNELQRQYFASGATLDLRFRKEMLRRLLGAVKTWEKALYEALWNDLHKSEPEAFLTEVSLVTAEIRGHLRHLSGWARTKCKPTPMQMLPSRSRVVTEPLGSALIIAPWNYPFQLLLSPLVGAISAGCTAMLKPSPYVPNVSRVIEEMISQTFEERYIAVVQGNRDVNTQLLAERWDIIFFTGSPVLGRTVMAAASKNLTPVVLELGGKSPCIITADADIPLAAKRIAWGKALNAGQTCIAPDYVLIDKKIRDTFVEEYFRQVHVLLGSNPQETEDFVRMVSDKAFARVASYISGPEVSGTVRGGRTDAATRFIEPTVILDPAPDSPVMTTEIFGPVLPVCTFETLDEAVDFVNGREKPLALYFFGKLSDGKSVVRNTSSGGACINDTIMHVVNEKVPFGGVGNSGLGRYHGKLSFDAFTHERAVIITPRRIDLPLRYMPYKLYKLFRIILG
ncbi:MAG: aldehyde dehydrogenase family protein [Bacteroidales bacterium]|nr:aldehyde dehydrogenase family protein [Bacteroidales bacterium]MDY6444072.1 aldehyde dehydrogenase family protein [Bacteroidales bacterium]